MERSPEFKEPRKTPEQTANYEGSHTLLLCERLKNPIIRDRLIENIYEHITTAKYEYNRKKHAATKEEIGERLDADIKEALHSTDIEYYDTSKRQSLGITNYDYVLEKKWVSMCIGYLHPLNGKPYGTQAYNSSESHEKGHFIRNFDFDFNSEFQRRLLTGFDTTKINISQEVIDASREFIKKYPQEPITEERFNLMHQKYYPEEDVESARKHLDYLLNPKIKEYSDEDIVKLQKMYYTAPNELIERMSQLKNYFGMKGLEIFTKEHLDYARIHIGNDLGLGGEMEQFFNMITPETEEEFIKLMNTLGI